MRTLPVVLISMLLAVACGGSADYSRSEYSAPPVTATSSSQIAVAEADSSSRGFFKGSANEVSGKLVRPDPGIGGAAPEPSVSYDQKLVKNAWLTIRVKHEADFAPAVKRAENIARTLNGYVANQSRNSIAFKVPTGRLDEALAAVSELGKVTHRDVTTADVTANYVDLAIRIENLAKVRARLQELVNQGKDVKEILEVEKELARVTTQLEALQGQMRLLENQTSFATVTVTFEERVRPGPIGWVFYGLYKGVKWLFVWD